MRIRKLVLSVVALLVAVLAAGIGLSFPIHFRAVSPLLLEEAAAGTPTLGDLSDDFLNAAQPGPVEIFGRVHPEILKDTWRQERLRELRREHPQYRFSGGPAPFFELFLEGIELPASDSGSPLLPLVLPRPHREFLLGFLQQSSNVTVRQLLQTREISGYQHFMPVFSTAGHPLDAAVLVTALLEQSNAWQPNLSRELRNLTRDAAEDPAMLASLERIYLAVVTLASRTNWTQLTALLREVPDPSVLDQLAAAIHQEEGDFATLYGAILLSGDAPGILAYLEKEPDEAWPVISLALSLGQGALRAMNDFEQPLYHPPDWLAALPLGGLQERLKGFTERQTSAAMALKLGLLLLAGYLIARSISLFISSIRRINAVERTAPSLEQTLYLFSAVAIATILGTLAEPRLLEFAPNTAVRLTLNLEQFLPESHLTSADPETDMIDQVTLIVLLMFFVLQLAVFTFSLIKLREIKGQNVPAKVKLTLLENEDSLFDLGLYIGLGGTVSALILVVMEFVEASLMAAYASTLFGIIFVAILKIFFLRPYRRQLILESNSH